MREPHLDLLAFSSGPVESIGASQGPSNVACGFVPVTWNLAKWVLRTASRFEFAAVAIMLPRQIEQRGSITSVSADVELSGESMLKARWSQVTSPCETHFDDSSSHVPNPGEET